MRRPRLRPGLRGLMAVVALAAALLGWRQHRAHEALRLEYEDRAGDYGEMVEISLKGANVTHEEWLEHCRWVARQNDPDEPGERSGGIRAWFATPDPPELERRRADYYQRLKAKYEKAALRPWDPVAPDQPPPRWDDRPKQIH